MAFSASHWIWRALALGLVAWLAAADSSSAAAKKKFVVYYSMRFTQAVIGFEACGLVPIPIVHQGTLFKGGVVGEVPDYAQLKAKGVPYVQQAAEAATHKMVVLDVEFPWSLRSLDSRAQMDAKATDYYDLLSYLKSELKARRSSAKLGYFEVAPPSIYQSPSRPGQSKTPYEQAVEAIDKVAKLSDVLFPQLYGYWGIDHFRTYTYGTVGTARSRWPGKPIYPFIWMQNRLDPSHPGGTYTYELVPKGAMKVQLETIKAAGADGVVIWGTLGNSKPRLDWDKNAAWWVDTKAFLKSQGANMSKCKL